MCGRFADKLSPQQHRAAVNDWLGRAQRRERRADADAAQRAGGAADSSSSAAGGAGPADATSSRQTAAGDSAPAPAGSVYAAESVWTADASPEMDGGYHATTNVAPTTQHPVLHAQGTGADARLILEPMRWGLLPASTKTIPRGADTIKTINARDDTILSGQGIWAPLFRRGKRCVVWAQGWYEWQVTPSARLAHFVGSPEFGLGRQTVSGDGREMLPLAGLWEECTLESGERLRSFTICTTEINEQLNFLHTRMPVVLPDLEALQLWLGLVPAPLERVGRLLRPYAYPLECYRVPGEVGRTGTDDEKFLYPIAERKDGIAQAFGRARKMQDADQAPPAKRVKTEPTPVKGEGSSPAASPQTCDDSRSANDEAQIEADRALALELEREESGVKNRQPALKRSASPPPRELPATSPTHSAAKPSSKFSPEPWNPPSSSPSRPAPTQLENMLKTQQAGGGPSSGRGIPAQSPPRKKESAKRQPAGKRSGDIRSFFS